MTLSTPSLAVVLAACTAWGSGVSAQPVVEATSPLIRVWMDPVGDAAPRGGEPQTNGQTTPSYPGAAPDLISLSISGWALGAAGDDPFTGWAIPGDTAHLFRVDVVFDGLLNPPGTIGVGGRPFNPYQFGPNPLYGFVEFDIDSNADTGGELGDPAKFTYLANVCRFAGLPTGPASLRAAVTSDDYDGNFFVGRQYERSGAEFALSLCGCTDITLEQAAPGDDGDGVFDAGETWTVRGRFLVRAGGFSLASGAYNGSDPGQYDPWTSVCFHHDADADITTLTLVGALDMKGASLLASEPMQPPDSDVSNQTSIQEAMMDVAAFSAAFPLPGPTSVIVGAWKGRKDIESVLNPTAWEATAIFAKSYPTPRAALYVWTDVGFGVRRGDMNADAAVNLFDRTLLDQHIQQVDGGARDDDGLTNGEVVIPNWARNFSLFDINYDGLVNAADRAFYDPAPPLLPGDVNADGVVNAHDLAALLGSWGPGDSAADINGDGIINAVDLATLLGNWGATYGAPPVAHPTEPSGR